MTLTVGPERSFLSDTGPMTIDHPVVLDGHVPQLVEADNTAAPTAETTEDTFDRYHAEGLLLQLYARAIHGGSYLLPYSADEVDTLIHGLKEESDVASIEAADFALQSMLKQATSPKQLAVEGKNKGRVADSYERLVSEEDIDAIQVRLFEREQSNQPAKLYDQHQATLTTATTLNNQIAIDYIMQPAK